jgi:hypothetical protein
VSASPIPLPTRLASTNPCAITPCADTIWAIARGRAPLTDRWAKFVGNFRLRKSAPPNGGRGYAETIKTAPRPQRVGNSVTGRRALTNRWGASCLNVECLFVCQETGPVVGGFHSHEKFRLTRPWRLRRGGCAAGRTPRESSAIPDVSNRAGAYARNRGIGPRRQTRTSPKGQQVGRENRPLAWMPGRAGSHAWHRDYRLRALTG